MSRRLINLNSKRHKFVGNVTQSCRNDWCNEQARKFLNGKYYQKKSEKFLKSVLYKAYEVDFLSFLAFTHSTILAVQYREYTRLCGNKKKNVVIQRAGKWQV